MPLRRRKPDNMDHILNILASLLSKETKDEDIIEWLRDHQEEVLAQLKVAVERDRQPSTLDLATLDDLFEEIKKRSLSAMLVVDIDRKDTTNVTVRYHGGLVAALGLVKYADRELTVIQDQSMHGDLVEDDDEDDSGRDGEDGDDEDKFPK